LFARLTNGFMQPFDLIFDSGFFYRLLADIYPMMLGDMHSPNGNPAGCANTVDGQCQEIISKFQLTALS
jgi:hypothetical protein